MYHPHKLWWGCRDTLGNISDTLEFVIVWHCFLLYFLALSFFPEIQDRCDGNRKMGEQSGSYGHWGEFHRDDIFYFDIEVWEKLAKWHLNANEILRSDTKLVSPILHPIFISPSLFPFTPPSSLPSFFKFFFPLLSTIGRFLQTNFN